MPDSKTPPAKTVIAEMEPFEGLTMSRISVVTTVHQAEFALEVLCDAGTVGFDTESKPTFHKGQQSGGPHVLQFATMDRAFIFQSAYVETHPAIVHLLGARELVKIGFGLSGDLRQISNRFGIRPGGIVDLGSEFRKLGYRNTVGAKSAIAILFERRLLKSKSVTTSNWAAEKLSERQLSYAANDAYAAICCHFAMQSAVGL